MRARRAPLLLAGLAVALAAVVGAGCGGDGDSGGGYEEPTGPAVETFTVEAGNFFFDPDAIEAPAGILAFDLVNTESGAHNFLFRGVPGFKLDVSGEGSEASGKVELEPGEYEYYCSIPGHAEQGMRGTLTAR